MWFISDVFCKLVWAGSPSPLLYYDDYQFDWLCAYTVVICMGSCFHMIHDARFVAIYGVVVGYIRLLEVLASA